MSGGGGISPQKFGGPAMNAERSNRPTWLRLAGLAAVASAIFFVTSTISMSSTMAQMTDVQLQRRNLLESFTAAKKAVVFAVPRPHGAAGLVYFDRQNKRTTLIEDAGTIFVNPQLSEDGRQLLFVRNRVGDEFRELVACNTASWDCKSVLKTKDTIISPVFIDRDTVLYTSSPVYKNSLPANYDFYLLTIGSQPKRLTTFRIGQLSSLNLAGSQIIFDAVGGLRDPLIPRSRPYPVDQAKSEIFALDFDRSNYRVETSTAQLQPLYKVEGYSVSPATTRDGRYVAFLNSRGPGPYIFNLVLADNTGKILRYIKTDGIGFFHATFVDGKLIANDLLADSYRVQQFDLTGPASEVLLELEASESAVSALDRITLRFSQ